MCLCGVAKNRIVTCGKCVYWFEKGYEQIGAVDSCKNTYFHVFFLNVKLLYQIILYYHTTKQIFTGLNWFIMCFQLQKMFWKNINSFPFWWRTYTKLCSINYVISHVKRLSLVALCDRSSVFNFRIWFEKRKNVFKTDILNQKHFVKNSELPLLFFENREKASYF